ncbi:tigger transposable element-derived protein 1-like isoform X2 [Hyla sarda]|uniref:tigger transposable element-derived protein 1-like isoform X2 n=1 Tax=Hyla sarda TaxID=327740 RepID=UPI0024C3833C|nr:tigger transposable element-derived protein 1-like isoform X2 [Hyla sarda]XP_056379958.1 tigger transposable element-derived protein 1-like isoform X2 [Hyla sarda]
MRGDTVPGHFICERAKCIFEELKAKAESSGDSASTNRYETFRASKGWFERFKQRCEVKSVIRHGEAASANHEAADSFKMEFQRLMEDEGYLPQQVFNCDETGLFWKKMPKRTFITREEASIPGHKPMKDQLTLLVGANASGDFKLKPMLVYHSDTPRVFKQKKIIKANLGVFWRCNKNAWVTRHVFNEWAIEVFCPSVKAYLERNRLPLKAMLLLDNAPGHDPALAESLEAQFSFITVKFLPPNTTPLLQPMDQQVISNFKKLYTKKMFTKCFEATEADKNLTLKEFWKTQFTIFDCVRLIVSAWNDVSIRVFNSARKPLWPSVVQEADVSFAQEDSIETEIVTLGQAMGLEVDEDDVEEMIQDHEVELTTEELIELEKSTEHDSGEEEHCEDDHVVTVQELKDLFSSWEAVKSVVRKHPDIALTELKTCDYEDKVLSYFKNLKKKWQRQTTLDSFFKRPRKDPDSASNTRRSGTNPDDASILPDVTIQLL